MANRTGKSYPLSVSASGTFRWTEHEAGRTCWKRSSSVEFASHLCALALRRVSSRSSERQPERFVWDVLNAVVGAPWKTTPGAQRDDDEVPAARYPIAAGGGEEPLPVRPAVRRGQGGVLGHAKSISAQLWKPRSTERIQVEGATRPRRAAERSPA